jgi:hypothetical protein
MVAASLVLMHVRQLRIHLQQHTQQHAVTNSLGRC